MLELLAARILFAGAGWLPLLNAQLSPPVPRPLSLEVERTGTDLWVTWDSASAAIGSARSGKLTIDDGGTIKSLDLDLDQLRSAAVLYSPSTGDVSFQLTVFNPEPVSESVRFRATEPPAAPDAAAPLISRYVRPRPLQQVQPAMTAMLRMLLGSMKTPTAQIDVAVKLDETGRVTGAQALSAGDSLHRTLASLTVEAARKWRFAPGQLNGKPIAGTAVISFQFARPAR